MPSPMTVRGLGLALERDLPVPMLLENDVNLAALAERSLGHGVGVDDFVLVSLGVGLGVGVRPRWPSASWGVRCRR